MELKGHDCGEEEQQAPVCQTEQKKQSKAAFEAKTSPPTITNIPNKISKTNTLSGKITHSNLKISGNKPII